jgi:hypothetical protein
MSDVTAPPVPRRLADDASYEVDPGRGWVLFAGVMFLVIGVLNVIHGIAAISESAVFVTDAELVLSKLQTWGWVLTVVGVAQLAIAVGIWMHSEAARWLGVLFAGANMIVQFIVLPAHPGWALTIFFVDVIVILGLVTYGGRDREALR